jgi:hypothetical protein
LGNDPSIKSLVNATALIPDLIEKNRILTEKNSVLEKNLKMMADSMDALTARLNKLEKQ